MAARQVATSSERGHRVSVAAKGGILAGTALVLLGLFVALRHVETADTYCGAVFYDTYRDGPCADPMRTRTVTTLALAVSGVGLVAYGVTRHRRRAALPLVLALASFALLLGALNRLLQPTSNPWCGSVLNPDRYYEAPAIARCDAALSSSRQQTAVFVVASLAFLVATVWAVRRERKITRADAASSATRTSPTEE